MKEFHSKKELFDLTMLDTMAKIYVKPSVEQITLEAIRVRN